VQCVIVTVAHYDKLSRKLVWLSLLSMQPRWVFYTLRKWYYFYVFYRNEIMCFSTEPTICWLYALDILVVLIMLRYINDLYEIWYRNSEHDLDIVLMSFIACCCWDLNGAKSWFRKWYIELLTVLWKYYLSLAWAWNWNIYCFEHKSLG
jgi:hypothetical protein